MVVVVGERNNMASSFLGDEMSGTNNFTYPPRDENRDSSEKIAPCSESRAAFFVSKFWGIGEKSVII